MYDIYELAEEKNRAGEAFRGPKRVPGTSRELSAVSCESRPGTPWKMFTAPSRCAGVPDRLMLNYYIPYTSIVASKVTIRCKLGGCYDDDSSFAPATTAEEG